jgi:hypothetical protein
VGWCRCEQCANPPGATFTREHLAACEARFVARMPRARRLVYFDGVERKRGLDGLIALKYALAKLPPPRSTEG